MVTHGGFLHYFTEDWEDSSQFQGMLHERTIAEDYTDGLRRYWLD